MSLLRLPCELLLVVAEFLETEEDINALSQVNRVLHAVINPYLYRFNAWNSESSALVWAAAHGVEDTAWISIREGAFPDAGDESGLTAMSIAAMNGHEEMVHLLLETGKVDLNAVDFELGRGPLGWAAGNGHAGVVQLLLESGLVDVNSSDSLFLTPLTLAAQSGDEAVVKVLLDTGKVDVNSKDVTGSTPLGWAAELGHETVARLLLETGQAEVNSKDSEAGRTPLSRAAENGHDFLVKLLIDTGEADVDTKDDSSRTPLSWAAENGHETVVRLLLETKQVNMDSRDHEGSSPLSWAARNGHAAVVKLLLESGRVDVDSKDLLGRTPLFQAVVNGHEMVTNLLLRTGQRMPHSDPNKRRATRLQTVSLQTELPMKRKDRTVSKRRSKPTLRVATSQNGHARDGMNSNIEMRKRDTSIESTSSAQASRIMSRSSFSLDHDPPVTPQTPGLTTTSFSNLPRSDKRNFLLLCVLYFLQGVPMGLATGSVPFLLKPYLSYGQIGVFSLASYPYSLKLLWSPIVDAVWSRRFGRRKSWITPVQVIAGLAMIYMGGRIGDMMVQAGANGGAGVWNFTYWWFLLVFFCATQDIAVDGWAITLMSPPNISYASTAQTVGLTAGHFLSYTVFLAFNSQDFANRWFRSIPGEGGLLSLGTYLTFWGWAYLVVTTCLAIMKKEDKTHDRDSISDVYKSMWSVLKLKNVQTIILVHLIAKIGFQANDGVTSLKLLDKGFGQDNMALVVLIDFPFEIGLGYYAGKWSTEYTPMRLWCWAFMGRLAAAVLAQLTVMIYPSGSEVPFWYMLTVIGEHVLSTFMNTVMFVAVSAFHARISDPAIGGTYMTLLATVSNLGGTFPRYFILKLVDMFTEATCIPPSVPPAADQLKGELVTAPFSCALEPDKNRCTNGGGSCQTIHDGYYTTNILCVLIGTVTFFMFIRPAVLKLQGLPLRAWRLSPNSRQ
ncbi:hypothetical protein AFLA_010468 [Aspergillus flavus NRRL3357]|nr:hypothetical protein AFLA_010468 [Aspergillus flavus NRRL3357]